MPLKKKSFLYLIIKKRLIIKNGWVKIPKLISKTQVDSIKRTINKFLNQNNKNYDKKNINFLTNNKNQKVVHSFHKLSDSSKIRKFGMQKKFLKLQNN